MRPSALPSASLFFPGFDKFVHVVFYFVLCFLLCDAFYRQQRYGLLGLLPITFSTFICLFYGGLIEVLQMKVFTYRSGEWSDFIADAIGTFMALIPYYIYRKIKPASHEQNA
ncbi:VanZ family protein [Solitalea koreensis]|nr:VanZ family protein [Solitalea koreensis]